MPKPTIRRTSLQPVFEPFELVDSESMMQPLTTNGYHSATADDDASLFGDLHCEANEVANDGSLNGSANGASVNGFSPLDVATNGHSANGQSGNGHAGNGHASGGIVANGTVANGIVPNGAPSDDPDLADLAAAKAALFADEANSDEHHLELADHDASASINGAAALNGHGHLNGDHSLNGTAQRIDAAVGELQAAAAPQADAQSTDAQSNGSAVAFRADASAEVAGRGAISDAPPVIESEPARPPVEPSSNGAATIAPQAPTDPMRTSPAIEAHPAAGSLFTPYLVTEIRELRSRGQRRRSWWRRLFG